MTVTGTVPRTLQLYTKGNGRKSTIEPSRSASLQVGSLMQFQQLASGILVPAGSLPPFKIGTGREFFVTKDGNDSNNNGRSLGSSFLTINRANGAANQPGDTVTVYSTGAPTFYVEDSFGNPYVPASYASDNDGTPTISAIGLSASGVLGNPITLRAAPGHEGLVNITGQNTRAGMVIQARNYIQVYGLRFVDCYTMGIGSQGQAQREVFVPAEGSTGCRIENCAVKGVRCIVGINNAFYGPWGTKDWIIYNCYGTGITGPSHAHGIQSYGVINALIRNNKIILGSNGSCIYYKDHFRVSPGGSPVDVGEVCFNWFEGGERSFNFGIMGGLSERPGPCYAHHNIGLNFREAGYKEDGWDGGGLAGYQRVEQNLFYTTFPGTSGISESSARGLRTRGNISIGASLHMELMNNSPDAPGWLEAADYNIFGGVNTLDFNSIVNRYGTGSAARDWTQWRAIQIGQFSTVKMSNPDAHSVLASAASLFVNAGAGNFAYRVGSPALGFMPGGSNAGPFQYGTEVLGVTSAYSAGF